jgi:hypothetical protein
VHMDGQTDKVNVIGVLQGRSECANKEILTVALVYIFR